MKAIQTFLKVLAFLSFVTGLAIFVWRLATGSYEPFESYNVSIFFIWAVVCFLEYLFIKQETEIEHLEMKIMKLEDEGRYQESLLNYIVDALDSRTRKKER